MPGEIVEEVLPADAVRTGWGIDFGLASRYFNKERISPPSVPVIHHYAVEPGLIHPRQTPWIDRHGTPLDG